jgi:hypothetical protein
VKIAAVGLVFIIAVYMLLFIESQDKGSSDSMRRTTYSASPSGYKALYLWLSYLGLPVKRLDRSLKSLSKEATVLMISEPEFGFGTGEFDALKRWVDNGGTLIFTEGMPKTLRNQFGLETVFVERQGRSKKNEKNKVFFQPGPYTEGVMSVELKSMYSFTPNRPGIIFPISDETGGVIAVIREGKGRVIGISDPGLFSNIYLKAEDNSRLVLNLLLTHADRGVIFIDEYHHGYGRATSVFRHFSQSRLFGPLIQIFFIILLSWALFGRRFGPSRSENRPENHSSMEYIKAVAQLHQKAATRAYAINSVAGWIKGEAKRLLIDKDENIQEDLKKISLTIKDVTLKDRELLHLTQQLYDDFKIARNKGSG